MTTQELADEMLGEVAISLMMMYDPFYDWFNECPKEEEND